MKPCTAKRKLAPGEVYFPSPAVNEIPRGWSLGGERGGGRKRGGPYDILALCTSLFLPLLLLYGPPLYLPLLPPSNLKSPSLPSPFPLSLSSPPLTSPLDLLFSLPLSSFPLSSLFSPPSRSSTYPSTLCPLASFPSAARGEASTTGWKIFCEPKGREGGQLPLTCGATEVPDGDIAQQG